MEHPTIPVNNFLLMKKIVDTDNGGIAIIGTFVQTVFGLPSPNEQEFTFCDNDDTPKKNTFQFRFNDLTADDSSLQLRRQQSVHATLSNGQTVEGRRTTLQATVPLEVEEHVECFPFVIKKATAYIELSSGPINNTMLRPNLVLDKVDRRGNFSIQEGSSGSTEPEDVMDHIDKSLMYDFITPFPEITYLYDSKKHYCPGFRLTFYAVAGGMPNFVKTIFPMLLISTMNTINVLNDFSTPQDIASYLANSAAFALAAVFLLPNLVEGGARQHLFTFNNIYIFLVFLSLTLSSIPTVQIDSSASNLTGMIMLWLSFLVPVANVVQYWQAVNTIKGKTRQILNAAREVRSPYAKSSAYKAWQPRHEHFDSRFVLVGEMAAKDELWTPAARKKLGYEKLAEMERDKFHLIDYC